MTQSNAEDIIISTTHGKLKGQKSIGVYGHEYFSFERVPYAQPPVGTLRFLAPHQLKPWNGIWDCTRKSDKCVQKNPYNNNEIEGVEDCLYVNVYVKKLNSDEPLPVMMFIHGGGFEKGDPSRDNHGPDYFMSKNVILVTIGYRLGPLGFLSLKDPTLAVPGNAGLKDQLMALQWFKQNAQNFNGDPNNITLFGESAGSASAHYMMLTPLARGLFHKAILQSGTVLCSWATTSLENLPYRLAKANGYDGDTQNESTILEYLRNLPAADLVRPYLLTKQENLDDSLFAFVPVVEPYQSENCIIPCHPREMLISAWGNNIPLLLGGTSFEGLIMHARAQMAPFLVTELQQNWGNMLPVEIKLKCSGDFQRMQKLGAKIKKMYFGDNDICMERLMDYCHYASDKTFWHPIFRTLMARQKYANPSAATYLYRFAYDSLDFNHQRIKYCGPNSHGVAHGDEHSYIFYGTFSWKLDTNSDDYKTIERMIDMWTSFAEKSNPNCEQIKDIAWQPLSREQQPSFIDDVIGPLQCLNISNNVSLIKLPELEKLKVWESLYADSK